MVRRGRREIVRPVRDVDYRRLVNPFTPHEPYPPDLIAKMHDTAQRVLREVGVRVLLPEARQLLASAGCAIDDEHVVKFDGELIAAVLESAPSTCRLLGASDETSVTLGDRHVAWVPAGGVPHASDLDDGKRPGTLADLVVQAKLTEHFDVIHVNSTGPEPQDIAPEFRHLDTTLAQLQYTTKTPFVYSRGSQQVADTFEMIRMARGLSWDDFTAGSYTYTVINTNSPLQLDVPMMQGAIDFARAGQMVCITPFTLAGAMAPVTVPGALVQQHAEFLAALAVHQLARSGAPVVYGAFTSNVDMRSGAPAFGTPENVMAAFASGQLARFVGLPFRSSMASTSNVVDAQAAYETNMAMWGSLLGGSNFTVHCAGWLEGGLTMSFEKFVVDVEVLQQVAELMQSPSVGDAELAFEAIAAVGQGGHFFGEPHTMERYQTAFYDPLVSDWSNFGTWQDSGSLDTAQRANRIWKQVVAEFEPPATDGAVLAELADFVARRRAEGGAPPMTT